MPSARPDSRKVGNSTGADTVLPSKRKDPSASILQDLYTPIVPQQSYLRSSVNRRLQWHRVVVDGEGLACRHTV